MKWLRVFAVFIALHALAWLGAHSWLRVHPRTELIVVDTSFAMKPAFVDMQHWIEDHVASTRYRTFLIGTDKAMIGGWDELRDPQSIFRTSFGRSSASDLSRYTSVQAVKRYWLSDGGFAPDGWTEITFEP